MPSPLGHALGGVAAAWAIALLPQGQSPHRSVSAAVHPRGWLTLVCAALAAAPDADLLVGGHRTATHSVAAVLLVTIVAAAVTGWVTSRDGAVRRVSLTCGAAYATHLLLDWLAVDRFPPSGIQLLWPFSRDWFISGLDLFPPTQRYRVWSAESLWVNFNAFAWETAILLPVVVLLGAARWRQEN